MTNIYLKNPTHGSATVKKIATLNLILSKRRRNGCELANRSRGGWYTLAGLGCI